MPEEAFPQHGPLTHVLHQEEKNTSHHITSRHNVSHASNRDMSLHSGGHSSFLPSWGSTVRSSRDMAETGLLVPTLTIDFG